MATLQTYQAVGNREDLSDFITNISVKRAPLHSMLGKTKATSTLHEYLTDSLDAPALNAQVEGADATFGTLTPRTRLSNVIQNLAKYGQISDNQEAVLKAGVKSEVAYQIKKSTEALILDTERALWQGSKLTGDATTAPRMGGVFYNSSTNNTSMATSEISGTAQSGTSTTIVVASGTGSGMAANDQILLTGGTGQGQYRTITAVSTDTLTVAAWDVTPDSTTTYTVYHTPQALTTAQMNVALQAAADNGGDPDTIFAGGGQKIAIGNFGTRRMTATENELSTSIDVFESAFGKLNVVYDKWVPDGVVACLDTDLWKVAYLRNPSAERLARTGTSTKYQVTSAATLEARQEAGSAILYGAA